MRYRRELGEEDRPLSLRAFAELLSEAIAPLHRSISHQSIKNWSAKIFIPDRSIMKVISEQAIHDWRGDFAREILSAIEDRKDHPGKN